MTRAATRQVRSDEVRLGDDEAAAAATVSRSFWLLPAGAAIAFLGAVCGIGGGLFAVPLLHYVGKFPLRRAVATSLCLVLATTATATVVEAFHPQSALRLPLVGTVAVGALCGAQLGYSLAQRIRVRQLRVVFTVVLSIAGFRILSDAGVTPSTGVGSFPFETRAVLSAMAVGFGGGFLAPLLGVGGGLLLVPGLFLLLPEIGYLGARAASLGVGAITAARSLFLYARDGLIDRRAASRLAAGALVGAVAGVLLVHRPGWGAYAQVGMGLILVGAALRFALDALRGRD